MSFPWIPCSGLTGPKWSFSLREIFKFVEKGLLTPYDGDGQPLLPEKFLTAQQKANTHALLIEDENYWRRKLDAITIQYDAVLKANQPLNDLSKLDEDTRLKLDALVIRRNSVLKLRDENYRKMKELLELERLLAEHSEHPWQSLDFTGHDYEIESVHIAKAFFKEAEVNALEAKIAEAKGAADTPKPKKIGFKPGQLRDGKLRE